MIVQVIDKKTCFCERTDRDERTFIGKYVTKQKGLETKIYFTGNGYFIRLVKDSNFHIEVEYNPPR